MDLPEGVLQGFMVTLALGLRPEPPQTLDVTYYDWGNNQLIETRYNAARRDSIAAAGRTYEAILIETLDPSTEEVTGRSYYRAETPRLFLSSPDEDLTVRRIKEGE